MSLSFSASGDTRPSGAELRDSADPAFSFAFQPIVDGVSDKIVAWEALIRGAWDEPAWQVLNQVSPLRLHLFDPIARTTAITLAARLGIDRPLHLNLLPLSLESGSRPLLSTIEAAHAAGMPLDHIVLELPEAAIVDGRSHFAALLKDARALGIRLAIDDFGATYASLTLLDDLDPDQIKLDMRLIRGVERPGPRQHILRAIRRACYDLDIDVIAEGVETLAEYQFLVSQKIRLFQGYLFARPAFEAFPPVHYPRTTLAEASLPPVSAAIGRTGTSTSRTKKRA